MHYSAKIKKIVVGSFNAGTHWIRATLLNGGP